jgi:hypothetical protein
MVVPFVRGGRADVGAATIQCPACGALALRQQAGNDASSAQRTSRDESTAAQWQDDLPAGQLLRLGRIPPSRPGAAEANLAETRVSPWPIDALGRRPERA